MRFYRSCSSLVLQFFLFITLFVNCAISQTTSSKNSINHLYRVDQSTGEIVDDTFAGTRLEAAGAIAAKGAKGWTLLGVGSSGQRKGMVYSDYRTGGVAVLLYGGADGGGLTGSAMLASPGTGWTPTALGDFNGDGHDDLVFVNQSTGQADIYFYGGATGTTSLGRRTISLLSTTGWRVVGAADLNRDSRPDLILQDKKTGPVLVNYLGGTNGTRVTSSQDLGTYSGWTASGMQDMNGDGHPDLILVNSSTGKGMVSYYGGADGSSPLGTSSLEVSGATQSAFIVPTTTSTSSGTTSTQLSTSEHEHFGGHVADHEYRADSAFQWDGHQFDGRDGGGERYQECRVFLSHGQFEWPEFDDPGAAGGVQVVHRAGRKFDYDRELSHSNCDHQCSQCRAAEWAALSGHLRRGPEAPLSWWSGLSYSASVDADLAYARTLVKDALTGTLMSYY